jgi:NAD(P)H-hydrate epimerase
MTDEELSALLPPIPHDANKYTRGSLLVLAGSKRFPGAAILTAQAAARTGAGYVTLGTPAPVASIAQSHLLSTPVISLPATNGAFSKEAWTEILEQVNHVDAIVLGPGLTTIPSTTAFVEKILQESLVPILLDADALNILCTCHSVRTSRIYEENKKNENGRGDECPPLILTPHAGELERLLAATGAADALQLAQLLGAIVVSKGPETQIISPTQTFVSTAGTPALAKAGTGDVLSGIIGSLLAQGVIPFDAAVLGVELHGRTGRLAEQTLGRRSVCAEDIIEILPFVLQTLES